MMLSSHYVDQKHDIHEAVFSDNSFQVAEEKQKPFSWPMLDNLTAKEWAKTF
jgi:hypothetical protein